MQVNLIIEGLVLSQKSVSNFKRYILKNEKQTNNYTIDKCS